MTLEEILARLEKVGRSGSGYRALCPAHDDKKPSLSIRQASDGTILLHCHAGCSVQDVVSALGIEISDLFPATKRIAERYRSEPPKESFATASEALRALRKRFGKKEEAIYTYRNAAGDPVGVVARFRTETGKEIRPISRIGKGWRLSGMPTPRPLYRLPEILSDPEASVWVFEGEKCADAAAGLGLLSTCSAGGANAAAQTDWTPLRGRTVVVVPDNDEPGRKYAKEVSEILRTVGAGSVRILDLARYAPSLPPGGDIADVLADPNYCGLPVDEPRDREALAFTLRVLASRAPEYAGPEGAIETTCLAEVVPREIPWLWYRRIPCGRISLFVGRPGAGKSFLVCDLAARVSVGGPWPDGGYAPQGDVLLLSVEDDPADTIRPRLDACGADCRRIHLLRGRRVERDGKERLLAVTLEDIDAIRAAVSRLPRCRLVVVDPVGSFLGPGVDAHRDNEVRASLLPLLSFLAESEIAFVLVCHVRKATAMHADDLTLGSRAFVGLARSVWHVLADPEDRSRKLFLAGKSNLCAPPSGLAFRIEGMPPGIVWEDTVVDLDVDDLIAGNSRGRPSVSLESAEQFLYRFLRNGAKNFSEVLSNALQNNISERTLRRAAKAIGVIVRRKGVPSSTTWELPRGEDDILTEFRGYENA